jgi:FkbM family methyltransferase
MSALQSSETLLNRLRSVEKIATASKFHRMLANPFKYFNAIGFREFGYKKHRREKEVIAKTFFGDSMHLLLPSATDIYLTGGKSHDSEIRLAKFLIRNLKPGDTFMDIGGHYGYFTLLGSHLVGKDGSVHSFEAAPKTFSILKKNASGHSNISIYNSAVSDEAGDLTFYEFPNLYSEYNSLDVDQFKNESWFSEFKPKEIKINSVVPDQFLAEYSIQPNVLKIDVEGAEYKVINGLKNHLSSHQPIVVIEYLSDERGNEAHRQAEKLLKSLGYSAFIIDNQGEKVTINDVPTYLDRLNLESDNVVFGKG